MTPARIGLVVGTRPEVIKMASVRRALDKFPEADPRLYTVSQHQDMLNRFLIEFDLMPDRQVDFPRPNGALAELTAQAVERLDRLFADERPDLVLVQGDTTTALCGALAAFYRAIPVGHVEAGLRTSNPREPFPEEMNRRLITRLTTLHFAPTFAAQRQLQHEGCDMVSTPWTGNTEIDELLRVSPPPRPDEGHYSVLVTCHRREALAERLPLLIEAVRIIAPRADVTWPVHPNPAIENKVLALADVVDIRFRMGHTEFTHALHNADLVLTDSGGVIEAAATLGRPMLILRDETERVEAVTEGGAKLVPLAAMRDPQAFAGAVLAHLEARTPCAKPITAFGDGRAGERIARFAVDYCRRAKRP